MIIAIGHRSGHGKDTFARYLKEALNEIRPDLRVQIVPWAWKLKQTCFDLYGHYGLREPEFYETDEGRKLRNIHLPNINLTPVEIWIKLGEGLRKEVTQFTWVHWLRYHKAKETDITICPDTRNKNELDDFHNKIIKIKLTNPHIPNREGLSIDENLTEYNGWDYNLINSGSKDDLNHMAKCLVLDLTIKKLLP